MSNPSPPGFGASAPCISNVNGKLTRYYPTLLKSNIKSERSALCAFSQAVNVCDRQRDRQADRQTDLGVGKAVDDGDKHSL